MEKVQRLLKLMKDDNRFLIINKLIWNIIKNKNFFFYSFHYLTSINTLFDKQL